jgi:DNA repair protein RadC
MTIGAPALMTAETLSRLTPVLSSTLEAIDGSGLPKSTKAELAASFAESIVREAEELRDQFTRRIRSTINN